MFEGLIDLRKSICYLGGSLRCGDSILIKGLSQKEKMNYILVYIQLKLRQLIVLALLPEAKFIINIFRHFQFNNLIKKK